MRAPRCQFDPDAPPPDSHTARAGARDDLGRDGLWRGLHRHQHVGRARACRLHRAAVPHAARGDRGRNRNGAATDDEIVLPEGTIQLVQGTLTVPTRVTIRGLGANRTIIRPSVEFPARPLTVPASAIVTLRDLTVSSGRPASGVGGNIQVNNTATLTLEPRPGLRRTGADGRRDRCPRPDRADDHAEPDRRQQRDRHSAHRHRRRPLPRRVRRPRRWSRSRTRRSSATPRSTGRPIGIVNNGGRDAVVRRGDDDPQQRAPGRQGTGIGGIYSRQHERPLPGSIVGGNTRTVNIGGGPSVSPSNCGLASPAIDLGGNVSHDAVDMCGLGGEHADPQLAAELDGSEPPVLAIPATSPAVDIADCGGRTLDQRGVTRPQLGGCDAGAYEYQPPPPEPTPHSHADPDGGRADADRDAVGHAHGHADTDAGGQPHGRGRDRRAARCASGGPAATAS